MGGGGFVELRRDNHEMAGGTFSPARSAPVREAFRKPSLAVSPKKYEKSVKSVKSPLAMREVAVVTPYLMLPTAWFRRRSFAGLMGAAGGKCAS